MIKNDYKEKKELTGQKYFLNDWLRNPLYKDQLKKDPNDLIITRCYVCHKKISLSPAGQSVINDHGGGKKHIDALRKEFFNKPK